MVNGVDHGRPSVGKGKNYTSENAAPPNPPPELFIRQLSAGILMHAQLLGHHNG